MDVLKCEIQDSESSNANTDRPIPYQIDLPSCQGVPVWTVSYRQPSHLAIDGLANRCLAIAEKD